MALFCDSLKNIYRYNVYVYVNSGRMIMINIPLLVGRMFSIWKERIANSQTDLRKEEIPFFVIVSPVIIAS